MSRHELWKSDLEEEIDLATGQSHTIVLLGTWVEIFLHDVCRRPLAYAPYEVSCDGRTFTGTANDKGMAKILVNDDAETCHVRWGRDSDSDAFEYEREIHLDLPPADDPEGRRRRLHNLGLPARENAKTALVMFQGIWNLDASGEADSQTVDVLNGVPHGPIALPDPPESHSTSGGAKSRRT